MQKKVYTLFLLLPLFISPVFSQSPGGVSANLTLWIKSNAAATLTSSDSLDAWTYANDNTKQFTSSAVNFSRPILIAPSATTGINFLPVVNFGGNKMMDGPAGANAPITAGNDEYCVFAVWRSTASNSFQRVWSQRDPNSFAADGFSLATWDDFRFGDQLEANPFDQGMITSYTTGQWNITQLNLLNQATEDLEIRNPSLINSLPLTATTITGGAGGRSVANIVNRLGARNISSEEALTGDIAELIVYNASVTSATVRNQVFSYLALKYGLNKAGDFIASDGVTKTWDSTANAPFKYSIFGIGKDDNAGLLVASSNSIETGNANGSGQSAKGNIVLSGASSLDNNDFLLIGNDNGALTETNSDLPVSGDASTRRLAREWKVQRTGDPGTVNLSFDFTGITTSGTVGNTGDFLLMIDSDGDGDFSTGSPKFYTPASFTGQVANFTGVTLFNNVVFTIITLNSPATLPVTWKGFSAVPVDNTVVLNWLVDNNAQAVSYDVQHAFDGIHFTNIGSVANTPSVKSYSYTHTDVAGGMHYYRIYQVDPDGKFTYSKIVTALVKATDFSIRVLSNPVQNGNAAIEIMAARPVTASVELWSVAGVKIATQQQQINTGRNRINVPMGAAAAGNYLLKIRAGGITQSIQVVKF